MLRGASLLYATVVSLIIAILCSSLILFSYFKIQERSLYAVQAKIADNVVSGIHYLMQSEPSESFSTQTKIDLFGESSDSILMKKIAWGVYNVDACMAFKAKHSLCKAAIIGNVNRDNDSIALYLQDINKPLFLCGETDVTGVCYLPAAGVKRGYIEGENFSGFDLINGSVRQSSKTLPAIDPKLIVTLLQLVHGKLRSQDSSINGLNLNGGLTNSFFNRTISLYSHGIVTISQGMNLKGNIIVSSDTLVVIQKGSQLNDIIVCAPCVKVEEGFNGNLQILAYDSIYIGKKCTLNYPSAVGIIADKIVTGKMASIVIDEGASITGDVFADNEIPSTQLRVLTSVKKDVVIRGNLFTNGILDLKGSVFGCVTCNKISLTTPNGQYDEYLLDATINARKKPRFYVESLLGSSKQKAIVKWVY